MGPELLPHLIPLLARKDLLPDVFRAMGPVATSAAGQLVDALMERRTHALARRRLPLVLGRADNLLAVQGLTECLDDEDRDVRFRCDQALNRIRSHHTRLPFPIDRIWVHIRDDLAELDGDGVTSRGQGDDRLRHLFNLLGVVYSPETMDICYRSISGGIPALRGTALELLDNQLPQDVKERLWSMIAPAGRIRGSKRSPREIARELLKAGRGTAPGAGAPGSRDRGDPMPPDNEETS